MNIIPINPIDSLEQLRLEGFHTRKPREQERQESFMDVFNRLIAATNATAAQTKYDSELLASGLYTDNLHNIEIAAADADLALRTMVSVRNKVLDAYSEIMRITL